MSNTRIYVKKLGINLSFLDLQYLDYQFLTDLNFFKKILIWSLKRFEGLFSGNLT